MVDEFDGLTILALSALLRARHVSPVELVEAVLERAKRLDASLKTTIRLMPDEARSAARSAEAEITPGHYRGPLHGVPIGVKDLIDVGGVPCTFGSRILADNIPAEDATVVAKLKQAGAVVFGKQNLNEFAFGISSENPHYGFVRNPWDVSRVPGGSSGGTAAAIAAGLCPAGLGSDTGGSIRIPAALCGTAGIKPTYGRVSRAGVLPQSSSLDHVGPLGRTVADCAIVLDAIAGPDPRDPSASNRPAADSLPDLEAGVRGLRLGVPRDHYFELIEPEVAKLVYAAIDTLRELGARTEEVALPHLLHAQVAGLTITCAEAATWHGAWIRDRADDYGTDALLRLRQGLQVRATEYLRAQQMRTLIQADFEMVFGKVDAILGPTVPIVAPPIGRTLEKVGPLQLVPRAVMTRATAPANLAGLPAVTVPCGFVDQPDRPATGQRAPARPLPVGLQVIGPAFAESLVLRVARAYERATDWHTRRPPAQHDTDPIKT